MKHLRFPLLCLALWAILVAVSAHKALYAVVALVALVALLSVCRHRAQTARKARTDRFPGFTDSELEMNQTEIHYFGQTVNSDLTECWPLSELFHG